MFEPSLKQQSGENIRQNGAIFQSCVEHSPLGVLVMDQSGRCLEFNQAMTSMLEYEAREMIGKTIPDLADTEYHSTLEQHLKSSKTVDDLPLEVIFRRKDGSALWVLLQVIKPSEEHSIVFCQDITVHKQAEQEMRLAKEAAEAANKTKSNFLTNMSHELRTPLSGVVGVTELLRKTKLDASQREYVGIIRTSSELLLELINDLLTFARIEAGKLELHPHDFNLNYLINDALAMLRLQASEKGLQFDSWIGPEVPVYLNGDSTRLSQIIINLASNAIKFTDQGSVSINLRLLSQTDQSATLSVSVRDTGIGIPADRIEAIFAPFTQANDSTSLKYGGTGLGLSICQQLAGLMGSCISVESTEGAGSTFRFDIEFKKQAVPEIQLPNSKPERAEETASGVVFDKGRILLAEDHTTNRRVIKMMIVSLGYQVDGVANGLLAVSALETSPYDLVLMDCQMPEMNGYEATTLIRDPQSTVLNHNIPIIALTANALEEVRQTCLAIGMNDFLTKPVLVSQLESILDKWIKKQQ